MVRNWLSKGCLLSFICLSAVLGAQEKTYDIAIEIKLNCPFSDELRAFVESIPSSETTAVTFDEWKSSFVNNMTQLINLVESGNVYNSYWSVAPIQESEPDTETDSDE